MIVSRLRGGGHPARGPEYVEKGYMYSRIEGKVGGREKEDLDVDGMEGKVQGVLERVMVMRVFDFVGVVEAVVEVGGRLESGRGQGLLRVSDEEEGDGAVSGVGRERAGREEEVADSEDEDFMEELRAGKTDGKVELNAGGGLGDERATGRVGMVVIDSIANVVSSMMTKNQVQGLSFKFSSVLLVVGTISFQGCQITCTERLTR